MTPLDPPLVQALVSLSAAVLMVYAGLGTRLLSWRRDAVLRWPRKPHRGRRTRRG